MGGVLVIFFVTVAGATVDVLISGKLGAATTIAMALSAVISAFLTRKSDLLSVIIAPPLIYVLVALLSVLLRSAALSAASIVGWLSAGFAPMALATGLALLIGGVRLIASRG